MIGYLIWDGLEFEITKIELVQSEILFHAKGEVSKFHLTPQVVRWEILGSDRSVVDSGFSTTDLRTLNKGPVNLSLPIELKFAGMKNERS